MKIRRGRLLSPRQYREESKIQQLLDVLWAEQSPPPPQPPNRRVREQVTNFYRLLRREYPEEEHIVMTPIILNTAAVVALGRNLTPGEIEALGPIFD